MKKALKAVALLMVAVILVATFSACGGKSNLFKIGIIQIAEHEALNSAYKGFVDALKEDGYEDGVNIELDFHNAQGDQSNCQTISDKFVTENKDLILAIATPAAQAIAQKTKTIPILVTAVTDPASADLVASNDAPGGNVSGTSDMNPIDQQIDYIKQILPQAKSVGILYCSSEANSKYQCDIAKESLNKRGMSAVEYTVSDANEIQQVVETAVSKKQVDAIYIPTDNVIASAMATVSSITTNAKLPVFCGESNMVAAGGFFTYGVDYYKLGRLTAKMAEKVMKGEATTATMPIEYLQDCTIVVNEDVMNKIGITLPEAIKAQATYVKTTQQ
ncbi:MAG: ABC transporter substrate-binding protein [Clostridiales bacterium]|nr:ABC transporter substrate-binding protein [Clostridiales bacterium]